MRPDTVFKMVSGLFFCLNALIVTKPLIMDREINALVIVFVKNIIPCFDYIRKNGQ